MFDPCHIFPRSPGLVHQSHLSQISRVRPQSHLSHISRARPPVTSFPDLPGSTPVTYFPDLPGSPPVTSFPDLPGSSTSYIFPRSPGFVHPSHLSQISRVRPPVTSFPDLPGSSTSHIFPRSPGFVPLSHLSQISGVHHQSHLSQISRVHHQSHLSQISRVRPPVTSFPDLPGSSTSHVFSIESESEVMLQYVSRCLLLFSFFHSVFTKAAGSSIWSGNITLKNRNVLESRTEPFSTSGSETCTPSVL